MGLRWMIHASHGLLIGARVRTILGFPGYAGFVSAVLGFVTAIRGEYKYLDSCLCSLGFWLGLDVWIHIHIYIYICMYLVWS